MMLVRPRTLAAALGALALHAAADAATMPDDMAALLPPGTAGLVYVNAPEALEAKLVSLAAEVAPERAGTVTITTMLRGNLGPLAAYWDASRPLAVAAVPTPPGGESMMPAITLLVPITDSAQVMSDLGIDSDTPNPMLAFEGDYAAMTMVPGPGGDAASSSLGEADLRGDLTVRLDMPMLMANYGPFVQMMMGQVTMGMAAAADSAGPDAETALAMVNQAGEKLLEVLEAGERTDLVVAIDGGEVEIGYEYVARKGSSLDTPHPSPDAVEEIARLLPVEDRWMTSVCDPSAFMWMMDGLADADDGSPRAAAMADMVANARDFYAALGPAVGVTVGMTAGAGIDGAMVAEVRDRDGAERAWTATLDGVAAFYGDGGVTYEDAGTRRVSGVEVSTVRCAYDVEQMLRESMKEGLDEGDVEEAEQVMKAVFGQEGALEIHHAFVDDRLVIGMGPIDGMERAIERVRKGGATPAALAAVLDRLGLPATVAGVVDLRRLLREMAAAMSEVGDDPGITLADGAPIEVAFWLGHDGPVYRGALAADAVGISEIVDAMPEKDETAHESTGNGTH